MPVKVTFARQSTAHDVWLTPDRILNALGAPAAFDFDPCAATFNPTRCAATGWTSNGLERSWPSGTAWLNPPYSELNAWVTKLAEHDDGIAFIFARTDTKLWHEMVFPRAKAIFFIKARISFLDHKGTLLGRAPAPSALIAYGGRAALLLQAAGRKLPGHLVRP